MDTETRMWLGRPQHFSADDLASLAMSLGTIVAVVRQVYDGTKTTLYSPDGSREDHKGPLCDWPWFDKNMRELPSAKVGAEAGLYIMV